MLISMTGFGRGLSGKGDAAVQVIVKSYNARFLEMKVKGLALTPELEASVREKITKILVRGTVHVSVENQEKNDSKTLGFNRQKYESMEEIILNIQKEYGRSLDMSSLLSADDIFVISQEQETTNEDVLNALDRALDQVQTMRKKEGCAIFDDTVERLNSLSEMTTKIEEGSQDFVKEQKNKMVQRLSELIENVSIDENRLAQEVAFLADRSDISEELVRIRSHIEQFKHLTEMDEPVGKRLSFLIQELVREINTVGSKSGTSSIINIVVDFKNQLEKIREQSQNIL
ncbi:MAG: YicC family protein [Candidatus Marinimicrobia bacterium]|nr:YicC family protein [Candidatus Neomarinimicrobiota bacterium]